MRLKIFKALSTINKKVLPKMYNTANLASLTNREKAVLGWKKWVTMNYLEEKEKMEVKDDGAFVQRAGGQK